MKRWGLVPTTMFFAALPSVAFAVGSSSYSNSSLPAGMEGPMALLAGLLALSTGMLIFLTILMIISFFVWLTTLFDCFRRDRADFGSLGRVGWIVVLFGFGVLGAVAYHIIVMDKRMGVAEPKNLRYQKPRSAYSEEGTVPFQLMALLPPVSTENILGCICYGGMDMPFHYSADDRGFLVKGAPDALSLEQLLEMDDQNMITWYSREMQDHLHQYFHNQAAAPVKKNFGAGGILDIMHSDLNNLNGAGKIIVSAGLIVILAILWFFIIVPLMS